MRGKGSRPFCKHGHPMDNTNTSLRTRNGAIHRACKACARAATAAYRKRHASP
jgi:hypothetical protein